MELSDKTTRLLIYAFGFLLFLYVAVRSYLLSLSWDEAYSYLEFVRHPFWFPSNFNSMSANNHLLNSWLMKICANFFGISEFSLRLPNLFAHVLYLVFSIQLVRIFISNNLKLLAFVLLNFNPYMLDFFSAARGYGLSMGFLMAALYFLASFFAKENKFIPALLTICSSFLALLSNLNLFPFFLIISFILFFTLLANLAKRENYLKWILQPAIFLLIAFEMARYLFPYTFKLKEAGALFFGGTDNYFTDTLVSLMKSSLYENSFFMPLAFVFASLAILVILVAPVIIIRQVIKKEFFKRDLFFVSVLLIILGCISASLIQHYWMGINFPMQRTALYLLPLLGLLSTFVYSKFRVRKWNNLFIGIFISFVLVNFLSAFNLRSLVDWREEAEIKSAMSYLENEHLPVFSERANITIGTGLLFDPPINFYRIKNNYSWLNLADYSDAGELYDYYLADKMGAAKLKHVKLIKSFSDELFLYKNEMKHKETILIEQKYDFENWNETDKNSKGISSDCYNSGKYSAYTDSLWQYSKGFEYVFQDSTLLNKYMTISCNAMVFAKNNDFDGRLVISFEHSNGDLYSWHAMDIRDQMHRTGEWTNIIYTRYTNKGIEKDDRLKIYLWNYGKSPIYVDDLNIKMILTKIE